MATHVFIPILGKRIRVTPLDSCGVVPAGAEFVSTDGFVTVTLSSEVEEGTEIIVRKANGSLCVNEKMADSFKRFTVEIDFCGVNPSLLSIVSNAVPYEDGDDVIGFTVPEGEIKKWFALELWTGLSGASCAPGAEEASGYMLLPFIVAGVLGDIEIGGEDGITFSLTGAATKGGNAWGRGPYNVVMAATSVANEVQTVTITGTPTGGTFTLTYDGQTTSAIAYNAAASAVQTALRALSNIGETDVTVTGGPGPATPYVVTFSGALAEQDVDQMTATSSLTGGSTPAVAVTTTTPGQGAVPARIPVAVDAFDHLLMIDTALAPPPEASNPTPIPVLA